MRLLASESEVPADPSVSTRVLTRFLFRVCVCVFWLRRARTRARPARPPALKHQQQITDGPAALEVFYFPAEARYVKNKHVQH